MSNGLPDLNNPVSGPFWRAASEHRLELSFCQQCEQPVWYPRSPSPCCGANLDWKPVSPHARLVTWTEVVAPINPYFEAPYTVALVAPKDHPSARIVSRLMHIAGEALHCDMSLRVDFVELSNNESASFTAPIFRPA